MRPGVPPTADTGCTTNAAVHYQQSRQLRAKGFYQRPINSNYKSTHLGGQLAYNVTHILQELGVVDRRVAPQC